MKGKRKIEDADGEIFKPEIESYFLTTTEDKHNEDNAPPMERKNMEETEILFLLVLCWQLSVVLWNVTLHYRVCQFLLLPAQIKGRELSKIKLKLNFLLLDKLFSRNRNDMSASDANKKEQNMLQCWQKRCVCLYVLHMILQCHKFRVKKVQKV